MSHPKCHGPAGHVCQVPSGRQCYERECDQDAGTRWGPYWCPPHDEQRLDRISAGFDQIAEQLVRASGVTP